MGATIKPINGRKEWFQLRYRKFSPRKVRFFLIVPNYVESDQSMWPDIRKWPLVDDLILIDRNEFYLAPTIFE